MNKLGDALFTKTQQKLLGLLYSQSDKSFYTKEILRLTGMGVAHVRRELGSMVSAGVLTMEKRGNQHHYQANSLCPIYAELKSIVSKTVGISSTLSDALENTLSNTTIAFVYGSIAKGTENADSDIDLMLVGENLSYTGIVEALIPAEEKLGRPINPTIYSHDEFEERLVKKQSFLTRVTEEKLIWFKGQEALAGILEKIKTGEHAA